jgi:signal transduction histidine kinase
MTEMDIKLECNLAFDGPVLMDGDRFRRVIYNIAGNAADAMPAGGKLIIDVAQEPGRVVFTFVDNGPGIPDEIQETLFEPFVTHGKSHGTGLGMAIVKKIVEQHGGQITYDSKRGQGTKFVVKLPSS